MEGVFHLSQRLRHPPKFVLACGLDGYTILYSPIFCERDTGEQSMEALPGLSGRDFIALNVHLG